MSHAGTAGLPGPDPTGPATPKKVRGTRSETEHLMVEAMAAHIAMLREAGEPVPEQSVAADVVILAPAAA